MKLSVDRTRCEGHGLCEDAAPSLLRLDDNGDLALLTPDGHVPGPELELAASAVRTCPVAALKIHD